MITCSRLTPSLPTHSPKCRKLIPQSSAVVLSTLHTKSLFLSFFNYCMSLSPELKWEFHEKYESCLTQPPISSKYLTYYWLINFFSINKWINPWIKTKLLTNGELTDLQNAFHLEKPIHLPTQAVVAHYMMLPIKSALPSQPYKVHMAGSWSRDESIHTRAEMANERFQIHGCKMTQVTLNFKKVEMLTRWQRSLELKSLFQVTLSCYSPY